VSEQYMSSADFRLGAIIRAGKGFACMSEGETLPVEADGSGNLCLRCQYTGQGRRGYHYPTLDRRSQTECGRLKELYLAAQAQS